MRRKRPLILVGIVVVFLAIFIYKTANVYPFLFQLIFNRGVELKQTNNNINVLLLGIGGGSHDGPNLTDTIILASINTKTKRIVLTSIPRDLWVPDLTTSVKKINEAYADGESKRTGGGLIEAKAIVGKITGQNIDYGVRIDFSGFIKAVDVMGGLDVNVVNAFDDYIYPISGKEDETCGNTDEDIKAYTESGTASAEMDLTKFPCRYKHLHFDKGLQYMDGETALEFVRSRHATGDEGSDFARSNRQEKIIKAFKDKALSAQTLINPAKVLELYGILKGSIDTDINQNEFDDFIRLVNQMRSAKIVSSIVDTGDEEANRPGLLLNPPISSEYGYAWVLIPRVGNGNFLELQNYITCEIDKDNCSISPIPTH
jgi:polyisoprenyl-teichoic acid--peptidoglycan teichoic acid transferase